MRKPIIQKNRLTEKEFTFNENIQLENVKILEGDMTSRQVEEFSVELSCLGDIVFNSATIIEFESKDTIFARCSFAGTQCDRSYVLRSELRNSRLQGVQMVEGVFRDVVIVGSKCSTANFRFCSFKNVIFDNCNLKEADFLGSTLDSVSFKNCDLSHSEFSQSKLKKVSFKGSVITDMHIDKESFGAVTVDSGQAIYLASVFGLTIED